MLDDEQIKDLAKLPKATLVNFVADVQGMDKLLDKKIERLLLQSDKPKLIKKLTSYLKGLRRRRKFLDYWENSDFVTELNYLVDDVMSLYPEHSEACLALLELFIDSTSSTFERVDDSNGDVGDIYRNLTLLWLQVAASCYSREKQTVSDNEQDILSQAWCEKVKAMADDNDYGTKDYLLNNVNLLLSASEIESLIEDYKYEYETLLAEISDNKETVTRYHSANVEINDNSYKKGNLERALMDLAWSLSDVDKFEKVYKYLIAHRGFSRYHFETLMRFMIEHEAYEVALGYLHVDRPSSDKSNHQLNELERLDWLNQIYIKRGDKPAQLETLGAAFELQPSIALFKQMMTIATPAQQASLRKVATQIADQQEVLTAIALWLEIGEIEIATQLAVKRQDEFDELHYSTLTKQLKQLPDNTTLIRVIIYRSLLNDILDNARSIAYGHAARYYNHLVKLEAFIDRSNKGYSSLANYQDYIKALKQKHGKKYSFWERVEN